MLKKGLLVFSLVSNFATLVGLWLSYASAPATVQNKFASMLLVSGAFASTGGYIAFAWLVMRPLVHTPALTENPSDESSKRVRSEASERKFSSEFVLEVEGTVGTPHWNFFLTNCTTELFRYVQLYPIRSEIGGTKSNSRKFWS